LKGHLGNSVPLERIRDHSGRAAWGSGIRPGEGGDSEEDEAGAASFLGGFVCYEFRIFKNSGRLARVSASSEKAIDRKEENIHIKLNMNALVVTEREKKKAINIIII
jgi:hypothetical protein